MSLANPIDINRFAPLTGADIDAAEAIIDDQYNYHPWDTEQVLQGKAVVAALKAAALAIVANVPPSADRSAALRKLREARMDANSAITHGGKY